MSNSSQYVAVMAGFGGGGGFAFAPDTAAYRRGNEGRIVALTVGGGPVPKPAAVTDLPFPQPPAAVGPPATVTHGEVLYNRYCSRCHVLGRGMLPDLRRMTPETRGLFFEIVLRGAYGPKGMARWDDVLTQADAKAIYAYVSAEARTAYAAQHSGH